MTNGIEAGAVLVEFGSGSSTKTEIIIENLPRPASYVPIDVSPSALQGAERRLKARFQWLDVRPVVGNFADTIALPADLAGRQRTGFFPGTTIGNLTPLEAVGLLGAFRRTLSPGGRLIVGVDLKKDLSVLVPAYNDAAGVTAAFNLNLLARINRELGGTFEVEGFRHDAIYNSREGRIEMHLVSATDQTAAVAGRYFEFKRGETIHTENSYKYSIDQFQNLARSSGWLPARHWTDEQAYFSVHELVSG
jgi:dimethylhistidine N-methyltransferase